MRIDDARDPYQWLMSPPIVIENAACILSCFLVGTARVARFTGPHTLYRATGQDFTKTSANKDGSAFGIWWLDASTVMQISGRLAQFEGWMTNRDIDTLFRHEYRRAAALPVMNNEMREVYRLELPPGDVIEGLVGAAAPQPGEAYQVARTPGTPMLPGGGEQVYFKGINAGTELPGINSVNPLWVYPERFW